MVRSSQIPAPEKLNGTRHMRRYRGPDLQLEGVTCTQRSLSHYPKPKLNCIEERIKLALRPHTEHGLDLYCDDIFKYYLYLEKKQMNLPEGWLAGSRIDLRIREVQIDWIMQIQKELQLLPETVDLAIHIFHVTIRRFLASSENARVVALTCMLVASKYEEQVSMTVGVCVALSGGEHTAAEIRFWERKILECVEWNLAIPYLSRYLRRTGALVKEICGDKAMRILKISKIISEITVMNSSTSHLLPSFMATTSVYVAMKLENVCWDQEVMLVATGYSDDQLHQVSRQLVKPMLQWTDPSHVLSTIRKKYEALDEDVFRRNGRKS